MYKGKRLFSSFSFWIDKGNTALWRHLKRLLAFDCARCEGFSMSGNTVVTSQKHAAWTGSLTIWWMAWIVLQPFSSFAKQGLHAYTLPPPQCAHVDCQKPGSRLVGRQRGLQTPSIGTCRQGWAANGTQYISPEMNSHLYSDTVTREPCVLFTGTVFNTTGLVGFKPKKFNLVHKTAFLMRGVVWAQDQEWQCLL